MKNIKNSFKKIVSNRYLLFKGKARNNMIALTFDDGPHEKYTIDVLKVLKNKNVKATFFVIGGEAEKNPELIRLMVHNGHEVANHSYEHIKNGTIKDIKKCEYVIRDITGGSPRLFRPPWGRITVSRLAYTFSHRIKTILWSFDSMDDKLKTARELTEYVKRSEIIPGEVLLFHEDYKHTLEALPDIVDDLKRRGFAFGTVSELLGVST